MSAGVLLGIIVALSAQTETASVDDFAQELDLVRQLRSQDIGREVVVEAYESLIARFPEHPRVAEAMLDLASRYTDTIRELDIKPDRSESARWIERAERVAEPGSDLWVEARMCLVSVVSGGPQPERALQMLQDLKVHADDDLALMARIERRLQSLCVSFDDLESAERHCHQVMSMENPRDGSGYWHVHGEQIEAVPFMIRSWASATHEPKEKCIARIESLVERYASIRFVREYIRRTADKGLARVRARPDRQSE